jgi:hypothetical protein
MVPMQLLEQFLMNRHSLWKPKKNLPDASFQLPFDIKTGPGRLAQSPRVRLS